MIQNNFRKLGAVSLVLLSISAILNLRGIPAMASAGYVSIIYYLLGALGFLLPSTLVCLFFTKKYKADGGIYIWVQKSLGPTWGFLAIWMEWINNLVSTPATLVSLLDTLSFAGLGFLSKNSLNLFITLALIYLALSYLNSKNIGTSSKLNLIGSLLGTLLPGFLIIFLGLLYYFSQGSLSHKFVTAPALTHDHDHYTAAFIPIFWANIGLFLSVLSSYSGMQIAAFHYRDIQNPNHTLPKALLIAAVLILLLSIGTVWAIISLVPYHQLEIITGVMQSFEAFFNVFNLKFLTPYLAILLALGSAACMSAWIIGPARGFLCFLKNIENLNLNLNFLPKIFTQINQHEMPVGLLKIQFLIGLILLSVYLWMPSITQAFWFLLVITSQFTLLMFALVFIAAFKTTHSVILKSIFILGLISVTIGFLLGFHPPEALHIQYRSLFCFEVFIGDLIILGIPSLIFFVFLRKIKTKPTYKPMKQS